MEFLILLWCSTLTLASTTISPTTLSTIPPPPPCPSAPTHAQPADSHYKLSISGDPDLFLPGELYTISLQGVNNGQGPTPFTGFTIWAEIVEETKDNASLEIPSTSSPNNLSLGIFQPYDAHTKLHEFCKPAVENSTAHTKTEIQVIWSAPTKTMSACVRICASASPNNTTAQSFFARKMCPAPAAPASFFRQPPIVEPCCACDEAKYEVTFEGLWSRNTHPRAFPPESAQAHFGDVIGASHTAQYRVWQEGRIASSGLRRLADDGATTALEKELKAESDHIRTIIKARGISWQQVASVNMPSTLAVFRVDAKNHLVSLASKLAPSPDWIVGVSALELCNANCTWRGSITLPLYPYDVGTDNGIGYTMQRDPTLPPTVVRALRPDWPSDPRSPFYSSTGDMRPFARLRLTRLRLYEKSCDSSEPLREVSVDPQSTLGGACATHPWGQWGSCSVSCGRGRASRQRHYVWPARAYSEACRAQLTDYKNCRGPRLHCRVVSEYEPEIADTSGPCAVSQWQPWSPCEGCGVRGRTRHYLAPRAFKHCHIGLRASTVMSQARPCDAGPCQKPPKSEGNVTNFDWFYRDVGDVVSGDCRVTSWGDWSPCSARCGRGRRLRTRLLIAKEPRLQGIMSRTLLRKWNQLFATLQNLELPAVNVTSEDPEADRLVQEQLEKCQFTPTQQEALCDGELGHCINASMAKEICSLPLIVGHCRSFEERWFYDYNRSVCEPFGYTGCGGNENNFNFRQNCIQVCGQVNTAEVPTTTATLETSTKKLKPTPIVTDNEVLLNDSPFESSRDVDCKMSPWSGWGNCLGNCKTAVRLNYRTIWRPSSGSGKPCSRLVKKKACVLKHCVNHIE